MKRILIVDDEPDFRLSAGIALRRAGYLTEEAADGAEVLEAIQSGKERSLFDLLLVDIRMPGLSGTELIDKLKKRAIDTPVLIVSGFADTTLMDELVKKGCRPFLAKPFEFRELVRRVDEILKTGHGGTDGV
ncbi:MAG: response regulator [Syntrophorhabdales bacterium]|jgi:CheY-like chemotaxis protein